MKRKKYMQKENTLKQGIVEDLRLSFSKVSAVDREGPRALIQKKKVEGEGVTIGGLTDTLLFEPSKVEERYYVFRFSKPTATAGELATIILENYIEKPSIEETIKIVKANKFWGSIKDPDKLLAKFNDQQFWGYIDAMYECGTREVITNEDLELANILCDILRTHNYSKDIVNSQDKDQDKYAQIKFDLEYRGFKFVGIIDMVVVNNKTKTIQLIDLKTGAGNAAEFTGSFMKYRYYFQAAIYQMACDYICTKLKLRGYTLLPFQFLYIGRYEKIPLLYTVSDKWIQAATKGFTTPSGYAFRGLEEVVDNIYWHWTNKEFNLTKELVESNGSITLKDDFITANE